MAYVAATLVVIAFCVLVKLTQLIDTTKDILRLTKLVGDTVRSKTLSDLEKEKAMQGYSKSLARLSLVIIVKIAIALGVPFLLLWGLDQARVVTLDASMDALMAWPFLLGSTVAVIALVAVIGVLRKSPSRP